MQTERMQKKIKTGALIHFNFNFKDANVYEF